MRFKNANSPKKERLSPRALAIYEQLKSAFPEIGKSPSGNRVTSIPSRRRTDIILSEWVDRQREAEKRSEGRINRRRRRRGPRTSVTRFCE